MKFSVTGVCTSVCRARNLNGADLLIRHVSSPSLVLLRSRLRKLDMVQHCKWIAYGTDGLGGKGCTRMRPKLHLPVLGHAFRVTGPGVMA
jgi:hypothetical protein